jgi:hypothetical protein
MQTFRPGKKTHVQIQHAVGVLLDDVVRDELVECEADQIEIPREQRRGETASSAARGVDGNRTTGTS